MDWGRKWLTNFNLHKCKSLSFGIQVNIKNMYSMLTNTTEDHHLERVEEEWDLDVLFSHSLKFDDHIKMIVHKVNRLLGLIKKSFSYLNVKIALYYNN